jgi:DNA-binding transcriptional MocR family regulator
MARAVLEKDWGGWLPRLRADSGPIYLEIADALASDISAGVLKAGEALPSQRQLAIELGINFTTVTRAYQEARARGLLVAKAGQGTFVRSDPGLKSYSIERSAIDLSSNWPPLVPALSEIGNALRAIASEKGFQAVEYRGGPLDPNHLEAGRRWLLPIFGYDVGDRLTASSGARGAFMGLMSQAIGAGGVMLTESMTWPTIKALTQLLGITLIGVETDSEGLLPDAFDRACRRYKAKALYCTPTVQNPTGAVMSVERRKEIAAVARARGVLIIEDDAYGKLVPNAPPPIAASDPDVSVYVSGLAKTLASGLRVAYVVCPELSMTRQITERMRLAMLVPPPIEVALATHVIMSGAADMILTEIKNEMKKRHKILRSALASTNLQARPGALHAFLTLPPSWPRAEFIAQLSVRGVRTAPSDIFAVATDNVPNAVRLAIGAPGNIDELKQALDIIGDLYHSEPSFAGDVI